MSVQISILTFFTLLQTLEFSKDENNNCITYSTYVPNSVPWKSSQLSVLTHDKFL